MTTNVPAPTFGAAGFLAPAESDILAGVQADQQAAFGGNLNPSLTTPQGQLAQSMAAIIGDKNNQFLALANGVDPAFAAGRMQDAIGRIYYIERIAAASTVVTATCTGLAGVVIPAGAQAQDQAGNRYLCTQAGTIPAGGSIALTFACATTGAIACPIGYLNTIYQAVPGWDSLTNAAPGVLGNDVETRADFELRRQNSVALNAQGSLPSILGAVLQVPGVLDAYATENPTSSPVTVGGQVIGANSIYVAAYGGSAQAIGQAIWTKKSPGCNYTGNTTVTVTDAASGYNPPYPAYSVTFQTPTPTPIKFAISMQNNAGVPSNAVALVQAAIIAAFTGADGGQRARIGASLFASRFYAGIAQLGSWASIYSVLLGTSTATLNSVLMQINQVPTISAANIAVTFS